MSENNNNNHEEKERDGEKEKERDGERDEDWDENEERDEVLVRIPPPPPQVVRVGQLAPGAKMNGLGDEGKTNLDGQQPVSRSIFPFSPVSPAGERIRIMLGEDDDGPSPPQLFTELDELLSVDGQEMEWKETAR